MESFRAALWEISNLGREIAHRIQMLTARHDPYKKAIIVQVDPINGISA
jgi:hypothetical protein